MAGPYTISSAVPHIIAAAAGGAGVDPALVLRAGGIEPGAAPRAEEHIDAARYFDVWRRVMARVGDPAFALRVAASFQLEDHEIFGFLAMSCETLGQAYQRTATFRALYCVGARWELVVEADAVRLIWYPWPGEREDPGYVAAMEFAVADMADAIRRLGRAGPRPREVRLVHPASGRVDEYAAYFGVTPTFASPLYELVYAPGLQELPIASFNSRLRDYFEGECQRLVSALGSGTGLVDQVRKRLIGAMDGGETSIETMAKQLAMSPRSLQRRLAEEGTGYNELLAEVRAEFAKRYLARGTISASEVAYLLGFTEPPAFFKAFKRWTGMTPREFQLGAVAG